MSLTHNPSRRPERLLLGRYRAPWGVVGEQIPPTAECLFATRALESVVVENEST